MRSKLLQPNVKKIIATASLYLLLVLQMIFCFLPQYIEEHLLQLVFYKTTTNSFRIFNQKEALFFLQKFLVKNDK